VMLANALVVRPRLGLGMEETKVAWPDHGMAAANPRAEVRREGRVVAANAVARVARATRAARVARAQLQMAHCGRRAAAAAAAAAAEPRLAPGHQPIEYLLLLLSGQERSSSAAALEE